MTRCSEGLRAGASELVRVPGAGPQSITLEASGGNLARWRAQDFSCRHSVSAACVSMVFTGEQISATTWKIVEDDRFGQYPFVYVRLGTDKCIVIGARRGCVLSVTCTHIISVASQTPGAALALSESTLTSTSTRVDYRTTSCVPTCTLTSVAWRVCVVVSFSLVRPCSILAGLTSSVGLTAKECEHPVCVVVVVWRSHGCLSCIYDCRCDGHRDGGRCSPVL